MSQLGINLKIIHMIPLSVTEGEVEDAGPLVGRGQSGRLMKLDKTGGVTGSHGAAAGSPNSCRLKSLHVDKLGDPV